VRQTVLLREHAGAVLDIRERAARVRAEMIAREVRVADGVEEVPRPLFEDAGSVTVAGGNGLLLGAW
jgi:hypothetical protein